MAPTQKPPARIFDGFYTKTGRKTINCGFRIFEDQKEAIRQKYGENSSFLVRLLIDAFLEGKTLEVEEKFLNEIERKSAC